MKKGAMKMGLSALVIVVVALFAAWLYGRNYELFSSPVTVEYFYMNGCPWCEKFMPEWNKFQESAAASGVQTKKTEASEDPAAVERFNIQGFPTVMVTKDGKSTEYNGERTADALMSFVKNV